MSLNKIVITREPGTEKTSLIHALTKKEHTCLEKISRLATINVRKEGLEQLFINQSFLFSEKLLEGCVKQYRTTLNLFTNLVFLDKCLPKVFTYIVLQTKVALKPLSMHVKIVQTRRFMA